MPIKLVGIKNSGCNSVMVLLQRVLCALLPCCLGCIYFMIHVMMHLMGISTISKGDLPPPSTLILTPPPRSQWPQHLLNGNAIAGLVERSLWPVTLDDELRGTWNLRELLGEGLEALQSCHDIHKVSIQRHEQCN
jgi:hypothetical protein